VVRNTTLAPPPGAGASGAVGKRLDQAQGDVRLLLQRAGGGARGDVPASPAAIVTGAFAELAALVQPSKDGPAPIDAVVDRLGKLYAELDAATTQPAAVPSQPGADPAHADSPAARALRETALAQPEPLKGWLLQLADGALQLGDRQQQAALAKKRGDDQKSLREKINAAWQSDVLPFCTAAIADRYPADRHSALDATPKDFGRLFAPGGLIDAFVRDQLKPFIDMSHRPWRWRTADDLDLGARPESLHALELAATWRDAFFRDGSPVPAIEFGVQPVATDATGTHAALALGEQQRFDRGAPARLQTWRWPPPDGVQQATLSLGEGKGDVRSAEGPWAWLRLLDQATLDRIAPDRFVATFRLASGSAQVELRAASVINPLQPQAAERFECPKGF
jgi:type VI secretion system protein ImpL